MFPPLSLSHTLFLSTTYSISSLFPLIHPPLRFRKKNRWKSTQHENDRSLFTRSRRINLPHRFLAPGRCFNCIFFLYPSFSSIISDIIDNMSMRVSHLIYYLEWKIFFQSLEAFLETGLRLIVTLPSSPSVVLPKNMKRERTEFIYFPTSTVFPSFHP